MFNYDQWFLLGQNQKLWVGEFFELIIEHIYCTTLQPGDIAIDGGANRGRHTLPMSNIVSEKGLVVGFEAIPLLATNLTSLINELGITNTLIIPKAIGRDLGCVEFNYVVDSDCYSGIKERTGIPEDKVNSIAKIRVDLTTIDNEVSKIIHNKRVRFIKLDLEGGEFDSLQGAINIMRHHKPLIVFENGRDSAAKVYGYTAENWFNLFDTCGYSLYDLFGRPFTLEDWSKLSVPWYFIAASQPTDIKFINEKLPHTISIIAKTCEKIKNLI